MLLFRFNEICRTENIISNYSLCYKKKSEIGIRESELVCSINGRHLPIKHKNQNTRRENCEWPTKSESSVVNIYTSH